METKTKTIQNNLDQRKGREGNYRVLDSDEHVIEFLDSETDFIEAHGSEKAKKQARMLADEMVQRAIEVQNRDGRNIVDWVPVTVDDLDLAA